MKVPRMTSISSLLTTTMTFTRGMCRSGVCENCWRAYQQKCKRATEVQMGEGVGEGEIEMKVGSDARRREQKENWWESFVRKYKKQRIRKEMKRKKEEEKERERKEMEEKDRKKRQAEWDRSIRAIRRDRLKKFNKGPSLLSAKRMLCFCLPFENCARCVNRVQRI